LLLTIGRMPSLFQSRSKKEQERLQLEEVARIQAQQLATYAQQQREHEQKQQQWEQEQRWQELKRESALKQQQLEHARIQEQWRLADEQRARATYEQRERERIAKQEQDKELAAKQQRLERRQKRMKETTPKALSELRNLIRERYQLDIEIWNLKGARKPDRPYVEEKMEKADAVLMEILTRVGSWTENEGTWTQDEWRTAQIIRSRLLADGKRQWKNNPPWNEKSEVSITINRVPYVRYHSHHLTIFMY
jgi:hypothetical protein